MSVDRPPSRAPSEERAAEAASFEAWKAQFARRAVAEGISPSTIGLILGNVTLDREVVRLDQVQPEFTRPMGDYFARAVSDERVLYGQGNAAAQHALLIEIERHYGVDWPVLVAIWGLETAYGAVRGDFEIARSLATLAWEGRRQDFAEKELIALMRIYEAGDASLEELRGSWAGAMGHTQFMPTSYLAFAQDFRLEGKRHIWGDDPTDALASTAHYLAQHGWQRGAPKAIELRLPPGFDFAQTGDIGARSAADWAALGVRPAAGGILPDDGPVAIILPTGATGPAFATYGNFSAIKAYNNSNAYALAVSHLADRILGQPALKARWPKDIRPLTVPQRIDLQTRLTALGYDTKGADGIIGPNSQNAIRAYQLDQGLASDGFASDQLLIRLGGEVTPIPE